MKTFALKASVIAVRVLAAIAGLFVNKRDGIVLISCEQNEPSQDILDLTTTLQNIVENIDKRQIRITSGKMKRSVGGAFTFIGKLFTMLRYIAGARIVIIDAYCMAVSIPKKREDQKVIQLWHAPEAIKKFSWQIVDTPAGYTRQTAEILCMHRNYDYILCPSDATRPFFSQSFDYPESVFIKYGLPSLDRIGLMKRPEEGESETPERIAAREKIYKRYPHFTGTVESRPPLIIYAPTFRDGALADAAGFVRGFAETLKKKRLAGENPEEPSIVLKLHPFETDSISESSGREIFDHAMIDEEFPLIDWYAAADVIVTDYSGVAVDAAAAGIASYYYIYDIEDYISRRGLNVDMRQESISKYCYQNATELATQILNDFPDSKQDPATKYDYKALTAFATKYLEVPLNGNTPRLAEFIAALL